MNKVLIITYYWPPSGGAGVQRWLKFSKYLPEYGWEPIVLTVDPEYASYPAIDTSLGKEVTADLKVIRTRATDWFRIYSSDKSKIPTAGFAKGTGNSFISKFSRFLRGNFFIPDPRRGWNRHAFRKACKIIEKEKITSFVTTSPPHSSQLIGLKLKKRFPHIRWIADLRDPWTDIYYYDLFYPTFVSKLIDRSYEKAVLKKADRIITAGSLLLELFEKKMPGISIKSTVITNGYDDADFETANQKLPDIFTITYVGTLSEKYPVEGLTEALRMLSDKGIRYKARFVGTINDNVTDKIISSVPANSLELIAYSPHDKAVSCMADSSLLVLIIPDAPDNRLIITGKIFEYIASQRPVLCIGPENGEAAGILRDLGAGESFGYNDAAGIEGFIQKNLDKPVPLVTDHSAYSRRLLTGKLASVL